MQWILEILVLADAILEMIIIKPHFYYFQIKLHIHSMFQWCLYYRKIPKKIAYLSTLFNGFVCAFIKKFAEILPGSL